MKSSKKPPISAHHKLMDFLARRDHSERELRTKLSRQYPLAEVNAAIERAKEERWLADPHELAERVATSLHRRHKGYLYILNYLRQKGLPVVKKDPELELQKASDIIHGKFSTEQEHSFADKQRIARFLNSRGFDDDTIRRTIYEEL